MGVWDYFTGACDSIARNSPDLTAVKSSYGYTQSTLCSVKDNGTKLMGRFWPNEEALSKFGPFAKSIAFYSAEETIKFVPGGSSAYKILKKSLRDANKSEKIINSDDPTVEMKALAERLEALEREIGEYKKSSSVGQSRTEISMTKIGLNSNSENVIREFMEKEFMGRQFLNDLIVPGTSRSV